MQKIITVEEAISKFKDNTVVMVGGFMAGGSPKQLLEALANSPITGLTLICNDTAFPDKGVGQLIVNGKVKKVITSHIGTNPVTIDKMNNNEIEVEFVPQGTLAERIRCGGAGLGGFLTPTGLGTVVANGKPVIQIDGRDYLLEKPLKADIALIGAFRGDKEGNLVYRGTCQNFNPLMAMAAETVIAEIRVLVEPGEIDMELVHTPSIFVDHIVV